MRIPNKIEAFGQVWKIKKHKGSAGEFDFDKRTIIVGKRFNEAEMVFLHEIMEAVMVENFCRYSGVEANQELLFSFNHTQFTKVMKDFVTILRQNRLI